MNTTRRSSNAFSLTAPYYDTMYDKRDVKRDVAVILRHIYSLTHKKSALTLLDVGCGTGTYALEFWQRGIRVTGLDHSRAMIREATKKASTHGAQIEFVHKNIQTYKSDSTFDVVVSLFDVLSYMTSNSMVRNFVNLLSSSLKPGGVCVFDCWYGPGVLLAGPQTKQQRFAQGNQKIVRKKTPIISYHKNMVSVFHELTIQSSSKPDKLIQETHMMRYFFLPEIEEYLKDAGLHLVSWGILDYPMLVPKKPPWSMCFVVQKPA